MKGATVLAGLTTQDLDVAVVGGGLAGLTAATYLARAGRSVTLLERSSVLGGRAVTQRENGFYFNLGPHALYNSGAGARVLRELGIEVSGRNPPTQGYALHGGQLHQLPSGPLSVLTTGLIGLGAKIQLGLFFATINRVHAASFDGISLEEWLASTVGQADVREIVRAVVRLTSYSNCPTRISAGLAILQAQLGLQGVDYVDRGWQTLVDGLAKAAEAAGVRVQTGAKVASITRNGAGNGRVAGIRMDDGSTIEPPAVVVAGSPELAAGLVDGSEDTVLRQWASDAVPVKAATLDLGLSKLPRPEARFVLGIDQPLYLSVHSTVAELAPKGATMLHVAKYLSDDEYPQAVERELEDLLHLAQPGWREFVVERRFLPSLVVVNDLAAAARGGLAGRPVPAVPDVPGLYVAGDWVGPEGWLSDASFASGRQAAESVLAEP